MDDLFNVGKNYFLKLKDNYYDWSENSFEVPKISIPRFYENCIYIRWKKYHS